MSKENSKKRIREITAFAAALLMVGAFSVPSGTEIMGVRLGNAVVASAANSGDFGENLHWELDASGTLTISYTGTGDGEKMPIWGNSSQVPWSRYKSSIKNVVVNAGVTSIGNFAFKEYGLNSITFVENSILETIGLDAFSGCSSLQSITIPKTVTSIGNSAFFGSGLKSITFKEGSTLNTIGTNAFNGCQSLESIAIPDGVTSIGDNAFARCSSLGPVTIPKSVTSIGSGAFQICSSITVDNSNPNYSSEEGVLFNKDKSELLVYPTKKSGDSYIIPDNVKSFAKGAFTDCSNLKSITIPNSVTSIGEYAFSGCSSLTSVTIPSSVESIGNYAFFGCTSLESITIPNSVTSIGESAFEDCTSLASITLPTNSGFTSIGDRAFNGCTSLASITIPNSVTSIGEYAFSGCSSLTSVFIPENLIVSSNVGIRSSAAQIRYTVDNEGNITITEVDLNGQTSVDIPETIGGDPVTDIADGVLEACPDVPHTHREKTAATCTEKPVCAICGNKYGETDPNNHSYTNYISDDNATCTKNGTETAECDNGCDKTDTREEAGSALGHDHSGDWLNDTADHWRVCARNDCTEILDKASHDYDEGVITTQPTEETEGVKTYTCETCGYEKTEPVAKLNHTHKPSEDYSKDETGHWHACSGCEEKVGFESHKFDEGKVTTPATEETEGVKTFTCTVCGYTKTETIPVTEPSIPETPAEKVNSFVERLYENVLGRPSDPSKESHIDNLNNGETATKVAYDFVFSPEFTELDISNAERVTIMYNTFLNRDPDPAGLETWTKALDNGCSIGHIFYGFTQSGEFGEICEEYGIEQGTWEYTENRDKSAELTSFVSRLYTKALNRSYDVGGLNDHTGSYLEDHDLYQMAYNFIFSQEFIEMDLSDEDFVDTMYRTFFDREADPDGRADWLGRLKSGCSRDDVLAGFVGSQECADLVARFGI